MDQHLGEGEVMPLATIKIGEKIKNFFLRKPKFKAPPLSEDDNFEDYTIISDEEISSISKSIYFKDYENIKLLFKAWKKIFNDIVVQINSRNITIYIESFDNGQLNVKEIIKFIMKNDRTDDYFKKEIKSYQILPFKEEFEQDHMEILEFSSNHLEMKKSLFRIIKIFILELDLTRNNILKNALEKKYKELSDEEEKILREKNILEEQEKNYQKIN